MCNFTSESLYLPLFADKHCHSCDEWKSYDDFHKNRSTKDGYASSCKSCAIKRANAHYKSNVEALRDKAKPRMSAYRASNKDELREKLREWRHANRDTVLAQKSRQRARSHGTIGEFTGDEWRALCVKFDNK